MTNVFLKRLENKQFPSILRRSLFRRSNRVALSVSKQGLFFLNENDNSKARYVDFPELQESIKNKQVDLAVDEKFLFKSNIAVPKKFTKNLVDVVSNEVRRITNIGEGDFHLFLSEYKNEKCKFVIVDKAKLNLADVFSISTQIYLNSDGIEYEIANVGQAEVKVWAPMLLVSSLVLGLFLLLTLMLQSNFEVLLRDQLKNKTEKYRQFNSSMTNFLKIHQRYEQDVQRIQDGNVASKIHLILSTLPIGVTFNSIKISQSSIELSGFAKDAAILVRKFEETEGIDKVEQISPIVADRASGDEKFNLQLELRTEQ